jgi:hypothetical protein
MQLGGSSLRQRKQTKGASGDSGGGAGKEVDEADPIFWFGLPSPHLKNAQKDFKMGENPHTVTAHSLHCPRSYRTRSALHFTAWHTLCTAHFTLHCILHCMAHYSIAR